MMKRTAGRPIGAHIREIISITEQLGPCTCPQIRERLQAPMELSNVWKYCSRAVGLGLLAVDRSTRMAKYWPAHGWRDRIELPSLLQPQRAPRAVLEDFEELDANETVARALRTQASSVFALAGIGGGAC